MISMDKTYKTRDGSDVRMVCVNAGSNAPVVAVVNDETVSYSADGRFFKSIQHESVWDLVEVSPYADFKIDEPVMVQIHPMGNWSKGYFAGLKSPSVTPTIWANGSTRWSAHCHDITRVNECRRPTAEELAS